MKLAYLFAFAPIIWSLPAAGAELSARELSLLKRIEDLEKRVSELEGQKEGTLSTTTSTGVDIKPSTSALAPEPKTERPAARDFLDRLRLNLNLDSYYSYNFNRPVAGTNVLRAYDVSSDSFSINQAGLILERLPEPERGDRIGGRIDLMFGQATETLQGGAQNELRPQTYRNIFQAYGTYVAPLGRGLTLDAGKWASSLGIETNYTKDQWNYSRSFFFNYLPFYHSGIRATYPVTDELSLTYYLVNGVNQTEDFNRSKSHAALINFRPAKSLSLNLNYYTGEEQRLWQEDLNPAIPRLPSQPGLPSSYVPGKRADGRTHIFDSYLTWQVNEALSLAAEADYVTTRVFSDAAAAKLYGGAAYLRYAFTPKVSLSGRYEYVKDEEGVFAGRVAADLREATLTLAHEVLPGFQMRVEYRRDWATAPLFLSSREGELRGKQDTLLSGFTWYFGDKNGTW